MSIQEKWTWKMKWCKDRGLAPANPKNWDESEKAYLDQQLREEQEIS